MKIMINIQDVIVYLLHDMGHKRYVLAQTPLALLYNWFSPQELVFHRVLLILIFLPFLLFLFKRRRASSTSMSGLSALNPEDFIMIIN